MGLTYQTYLDLINELNKQGYFRWRGYYEVFEWN